MIVVVGDETIVGVDGDASFEDKAAAVMTSVDATRKHIKSYIYTLMCMQCSLPYLQWRSQPCSDARAQLFL